MLEQRQSIYFELSSPKITQYSSIMKTAMRNLLVLLIVGACVTAVGCKSGKGGHGKKPKCRTCPKWEDKIEVDAEAHGLRERP